MVWEPKPAYAWRHLKACALRLVHAGACAAGGFGPRACWLLTLPEGGPPACARVHVPHRTLHTAEDATDPKWVMQQWVVRGWGQPKAPKPPKQQKKPAVVQETVTVPVADAGSGGGGGAKGKGGKGKGGKKGKRGFK